MRQLTNLEFIVTSEGDEQGLLESMFSLTGLRSLSLSSGWIIQRIPSEITERLTALTRLTELRLHQLPGDHPLRFPESILDIELHFPNTFPEDLPEALMELKNLTSLNIHNEKETHLFHSGIVTPFDFFNELGQLKALFMWNVCVDPPFLGAFKALAGLTELHLDGTKVQMDHNLVCRQLSFLSNLEKLKIPFPELLVDDEAGVLQGCLPKLRRIYCGCLKGTVEEDIYLAMVKAFPRLRSVQ